MSIGVIAAVLLLLSAVSSSAAPFTNGSFESFTGSCADGNCLDEYLTLPVGSTALDGWTIGGGGIDIVGKNFFLARPVRR
jgi:hypothetical protein